MKSFKAYILSWKCLRERGEKMALSLNPSGELIITRFDLGNKNQEWYIVPNYTGSADSWGFTLVNEGTNRAIESRGLSKQIIVSSDVRPESNPPSYWTIEKSGSMPNRRFLYTFWSFERKGVMDVEKGSCNRSTKVLLYNSNGADNQKWSIELIR